MADVDRLYVDSNVFIRLFEGSDGLTEELRRLFLVERRGREPFLATSEFTLAELLVDPYRRRDDQLIQLYDNWTQSSEYLTVGPVTRDVLWYAAVLRSQYKALKLPDAIHLSSAIGFHCSHVLTADERLSDTYELSHSRYGLIRGPVRLEILRPGIELLKQLIKAAAR